MVCCAILSTFCQSDTDMIDNDGQTELASVESGLGKERLVALDVCRVFDGIGASSKSAFSEIGISSNPSDVRLRLDNQINPNHYPNLRPTV